MKKIKIEIEIKIKFKKTGRRALNIYVTDSKSLNINYQTIIPKYRTLSSNIQSNRYRLEISAAIILLSNHTRLTLKIF